VGVLPLLQVCRLVRDFPSFGRVRYGIGPGLYNLTLQQARLGVSVSVVSAQSGGTPVFEARGRVSIYRVRTPYNLYSLGKMRDLARQGKVDLVHAHATHGISYALLRRLVLDRPLVVHVHDTTAGAVRSGEYFPFRRGFKTALKEHYIVNMALLRQRLMWRKADRLIAVCTSVANELSEDYGIPRDRIRVVFNGVDPDTFRPSPDKQQFRKELGLEGDPVVLFVGHFGLRKGSHQLLKAIPAILKSFPRALFVLVGGTPSFLASGIYWSALRDLVARSGIGERVRFVGTVPYDDVVRYYWAADLFVLPTLYEGLPKVVLEAMACGLPVITTRVSGNTDAVVDGETGILVDPRSVEQLRDAMLSLLSDPGMMRLMSVRGRRRAVELFTWERAAKEVSNVYDEILPR
jgi:glycosyltransferase involved in cell wall biosynthesis